jgi:MATE family multidrug resistance protein
MSASATLLALEPRGLVRLFTSDPEVIQIGIGLLLVARVFQLFDGVQAVATGALRGLGNTHTPMLVNLVGHWLMGLPWRTCCVSAVARGSGIVDWSGVSDSSSPALCCSACGTGKAVAIVCEARTT